MNTNLISRFPLIFGIILSFVFTWGVCDALPISGQAPSEKQIEMKPDRLGTNAASANSLLGKRLKNILRTQGMEEFVLAQNTEAMDSQGQSLLKITSLTTEKGLNGESVITIESSGPIQYTAFKLLNPLRLVLDFQNMAKGEVSPQIQADNGIVGSIKSMYFDEVSVMRLEIVLNKAADYDIKKPSRTQLVVSLSESPVQVIAEAPAPQIEEKDVHPAVQPQLSNEELRKVKDKLAETKEDPCEPLLSGEKQKISLDFQDAELKNLFRIFSEISGFNLILASDVAGKVNMRLMNVAWNQAFEVILDNSGLGRVCLGGNIIRIATKLALAEEEQLKIDALNRKREEEESEKKAEELVTEVVRINYADIDELNRNLNELAESLDPANSSTGGGGGGGGGLRRRGRITVDVRTNTIILTDIRKNLDDMLALIRVLDVQSPQVMIEARIVEVTKNFSQDLGIQWGITGQLDGRTPSTTNATLTGITAGSDFLVDIPIAASTGGFGLALGGLAKGLDLDIQLNALEEQKKARILSSPKITTLNNREARIKQGDRIPFETVSADGTSTEFIDAELSLTVTPHISSDDFILMKIDATKNTASTAFSTASSPASISTKEASTEVLVANGDTTVLGGIYTSSVREDEDAVPFFSKIPIFGLLFRNFEDEDVITELLIFITPTILRNEGVAPTL